MTAPARGEHVEGILRERTHDDAEVLCIANGRRVHSNIGPSEYSKEIGHSGGKRINSRNETTLLFSYNGLTKRGGKRSGLYLYGNDLGAPGKIEFS